MPEKPIVTETFKSELTLDRKMIVVTSPTVPGKTIIRTIGLVSGNTIRARHVGKDILAGLRNLVGGEITEYAKLLAESREQAIDRMIAPRPSAACS